MKQFVSILFILIIIIQPLNRMRIILSFNLNHRYIAAFLCEKKDQPENSCNGKCWLKKELSKDENARHDQLPSNRIELPWSFFVTNADMDEKKKIYSVILNSFCVKQPETTLPGYKKGVFHPPQNLFFS